MSTTEQENRLAQLKELQEELQNKLLSQLSSANYDENSISEETRLEIIETLGEKVEESSRQQQEEQPNNELTFSLSSLTTSTNAASSPNKSPSSSNCASSVYLNAKDGETKRADQDTRPDTDSAHISKGTADCTESPVPSADKTQPVNISNIRIKDALCSDDANPGSAPLGTCTEAITASATSPFFTSSSYEGTSIKHTSSPTPVVSPPSNSSSRRSSPSPSWKNTSPSVLNDTIHDIRTSPLHQQKTAVSPGKDGRKRLPVSTDCGECQSLRVHLEHLLADNGRWKVECNKLEEHIEECMSINKNFMDKNNRLMRRIASYQQECESKEQLVTVLQSRVGSMSDQLMEHDKLIADLRERNEELEEELGCVGREKKDIKELLHQTMSELDIKKVEVARIEAKMRTMESQLFNADSEAHRLKDIIAMMMEKENQLNSTIYSLEEEIKSLRHINNRLNGQYTHFKLSNDDAYSTDQSNHSLTCSNVSDEGKLTTPQTGSQQQWKQSPRFTSSAGTIDTPPLDTSKDKQQMLTRRKWLEQSEGGFVFGTPSRTNERKDNKENDTVYSPRPPLTPRNMPRPSPRSPNEGGANPRRYTPVNNRGTSAGGNHGESSSGRRIKSPRERIEDKVEERLRQVPLVEKRLLELQKEKEKLEHVLSRAPPTAKVTAQSKQMMIDAENRLDEVLKEIGAARLFLWKK